VMRSDMFGIADFWRNLKGDFRARRYFMKLSDRPFARAYVFYGVSLLSYAVKRLRRLLRKSDNAVAR